MSFVCLLLLPAGFLGCGDHGFSSPVLPLFTLAGCSAAAAAVARAAGGRKAGRFGGGFSGPPARC